jgi:hypothetical protein
MALPVGRYPAKGGFGDEPDLPVSAPPGYHLGLAPATSIC